MEVSGDDYQYEEIKFTVKKGSLLTEILHRY